MEIEIEIGTPERTRAWTLGASVALACKRPLDARLATGLGLSVFLSFVCRSSPLPTARSRPLPAEMGEGDRVQASEPLGAERARAHVQASYPFRLVFRRKRAKAARDRQTHMRGGRRGQRSTVKGQRATVNGQRTRRRRPQAVGVVQPAGGWAAVGRAGVREGQ